MATYIQIGSTVTVGALGASTIDFTSIPSTYTDLLLKVSTRITTSTVTDLFARLNGSSASVYSYKQMYYEYGTSANANSDGGSSQTSLTHVGRTTESVNYTSSTFSNNEFYIPNYLSTSNAKTVATDAVSENNANANYLMLAAGLWNPSTQAAITSISIFPASPGTFVQYTTASLYGIKSS